VQNSLKNGHFFFYLSLQPQLVDLFLKHKLLELVTTPNAEHGTFQDLTSGNLYRSVHNMNSFASINLRLTFNCDGVPVFKSSRFSIWQILCEEMMFRSVENVNALIAEAVETSKPCLGVEGPSLLSLLLQFDIVHGMVPNYMHCICQGVVRQMARLWFDSKNHNEPFFIGKSTSLIDRRLLAIKPSCSLSITPRSIVYLKF